MKRLLILFALLCWRVYAQPSPLPQIYYVTSAPAGACTVAQPLGIEIVVSTLAEYGCVGPTIGQAGTWQLMVGGGGSGVLSVTGTAPIVASPTTGAVLLSCAVATGSVAGCLSAADWNTFNNKGSGSVTSAVIAGTANEITADGTCTITSSGTCTLSIPSNAVFPGNPQAVGILPSTDVSQNLATTTFVKGLIGALNLAVSVQAATVTVLPNSPTYSNGTAGVGATLTAGSNGVLTIDGYTVLLNDRLLINNQASAFQNGVYTVTTLGTGGVPYVLTRATDFNTIGQINTSGAIPVLNGTVNNNTIWVLNNSIAAIGTPNSINYSLGSTTPFPVLTITNASSTGTTLQKLAKLTGAPSTAVINNTADTTGAIGICVSNCGTTGAASIQESGIGACVFDGSTTAGDFVQISATTNGDCHDAGATFPTSGEVVGRALSTNTGGGTYALLLYSPDVAASSTKTIGSGTITLSTSAITSGTCTAAQTVTITGTATTDNVMVDFNADPTGTTGYAPSANGGLFIYKYPTTNTVNVKICNNTGASITPGAALVLNVRVVR